MHHHLNSSINLYFLTLPYVWLPYLKYIKVLSCVLVVFLKKRCKSKIIFPYKKTDAGSSVISSSFKHRANDARDGFSSYSNRRDQSGLNGCCTAMWKANGKTTTLSLFLDSLLPKTEIPYCQLKEEALDRSMWRNRFGRGFGPVV